MALINFSNTLEKLQSIDNWPKVRHIFHTF